MNTFTKTLLTVPTLLAAQSLAAESPATQPATQPSTPALVNANRPLVIPDGTTPQNPGPSALQFTRNWIDQNGNPMPTTGVRG